MVNYSTNINKTKDSITIITSLQFSIYIISWRYYLLVFDFKQYFNYIMATSFSCGRSRSTRIEPPTMGKQLVSFITCSCESSTPFL
jgi:hypothetical protein